MSAPDWASRPLICLDSFKGKLDSASACQKAAEAWERIFPGSAPTICPLSDGGDGLIDAVAHHLDRRGILITRKSEGVLCADLPGKGRFAWIESAAFLSGFADAPLSRRSSAPLAHALQELALTEPDRLILGLGGSKTAELGIGAFATLGGVAVDTQGRRLHATVEDWTTIHSLVPPESGPLQEKALQVWADVEVSSRHVVDFIPQKGGTAEDQERVRRVLEALKPIYAQELMEPFDARLLAGGAAGGVLIGLDLARIPLQVRNGLQGFLDLLVPEWNAWWNEASCIVSGSGRIDGTSLLGKAEYQLALRAQNQDKRCILLPGDWDRKSMVEISRWIRPVGERFDFEQALRSLGKPG